MSACIYRGSRLDVAVYRSSSCLAAILLNEACVEADHDVHEKNHVPQYVDGMPYTSAVIKNVQRGKVKRWFSSMRAT